jgi:hypothetical protein
MDVVFLREGSMQAEREQALLEVLPDDVSALAARLGVLEQVEALFCSTRAIFPGESVAVCIEDDPEMPDDQHFVFTTTAHGDVDSIVAQHDAWHRNLRSITSPKPGLFRLGID